MCPTKISETQTSDLFISPNKAELLGKSFFRRKINLTSLHISNRTNLISVPLYTIVKRTI